MQYQYTTYNRDLLEQECLICAEKFTKKELKKHKVISHELFHDQTHPIHTACAKQWFQQREVCPSGFCKGAADTSQVPEATPSRFRKFIDSKIAPMVQNIKMIAVDALSGAAGAVAIPGIHIFGPPLLPPIIPDVVLTPALWFASIAMLRSIQRRRFQMEEISPRVARAAVAGMVIGCASTAGMIMVGGEAVGAVATMGRYAQNMSLGAVALGMIARLAARRRMIARLGARRRG